MLVLTGSTRFVSDTTNAASNEGSGGFIGDIDPYQSLNFDFDNSFYSRNMV